MAEFVKAVADGILDLIYPPKCLICGTMGEEWICKSCLSRIDPVPQPYCDRCGHPLLAPQCNNCLGRVSSFKAARAAGEYSGVFKDAIHQFKYSGHRMLASPLAHVLHNYLETDADLDWNAADVIVPVPIHHVRKRLRGYNQSELLAKELSRLTGKPVVTGAVKRIIRTKAQVDLSRTGRRENMKGAFRVVSPEVIKGKKVLLIDDVATTCSTVHECSLALRAGGATRVYVLCLAFGS